MGRGDGTLLALWQFDPAPETAGLCPLHDAASFGRDIRCFHLSGDTQPFLLETARVMTFGGSLLLWVAILAMLSARHGRLAWLIVPVGLVWALTQWPITGDSSAVMLRAANVCYMLFLLTLLLVYRRDQTLFSPVTVSGFWFLLVFVAVTIINTRIATTHGLPSLAYDDVLHGASESLLSISNLLIVVGVSLKIKQCGRLSGQPVA